MAKGAPLSEDEKLEILILHREKRSIRYIAEELGRSRGCISGFLKDPEHYGTLRSTGRPPSLTKHEHRRLLRAARTGKYTAGELVERHSLPVGRRRVCQLLNKSGKVKFKKRLAAPMMTRAHQKARVLWASEAKNWGAKFDNIIWSDEKKWNLDGPDGYNYYWADLTRRREHFSKRQNGGGGVMVWGGFSSRGTTELAFLEGKQDAEAYIATLSDHLLPFAHANHGDGYFFQQDNASIHTAGVVARWFEEPDIDVEVIQWPAKSPDLNPIENLWGIMSRKVYDNGKRKFATRAELKACIRQVWSELDLPLLQKLVDSMPKRCDKVVDSKGRKINY
jgi:transposase